jgi:hypothetical protein
MTVFETLKDVNVNGHTEKKNGLTYLSWAWAWAELLKRYPDSTYTVYENADGWCYHTDGRTAWVKTGVTVEGKEYIEMLPVMDFKNRSIPLDAITSMDVNKAIQRSLTKAVARHGLGLYIYAGEDLPEDEADAQKTEKAAPVTMSKTSTVYNPKTDIASVMQRYGVDKEGFFGMRQTLITAGMIDDKPSAEMAEADWRKLFAAIYEYFGEVA